MTMDDFKPSLGSAWLRTAVQVAALVAMVIGATQYINAETSRLNEGMIRLEGQMQAMAIAQDRSLPLEERVRANERAISVLQNQVQGLARERPSQPYDGGR